MKVTLVISSLDTGGAERVMSTMANYWAARGWQVTLLTFANIDSQPFYRLEPSVRHIPLCLCGESRHLFAGLLSNIKRVRVLRKAIRESQPKVVISFIDQVNVLTLLSTMGLDINVVVSERTDPNVYRIGFIWERLRWWIYFRARKIVVQTDSARQFFLPRYSKTTCLIPNPVVVDKFSIQENFSNSPAQQVISMGRLVEEKGFDLLIRAFSELTDQFPDWRLKILGEGPERPKLISLCQSLGVSARVQMPGIVKNSLDFLKRSQLFVLSSRFEGFPNALLEAMACGLPVIATDCHSGPRDLICNGENGILVPVENVELLRIAMAQLMENETDRRRLGLQAQVVCEQFSLKRIMGLWEAALSV